VTDGAFRLARQDSLPRLSIELTGIPGSGKSRLTRTLIQGLTGRGVAVREPQAPFAPSVPLRRRLAQKALASGSAALTSPLDATRVTLGIVRSHQPDRADLANRVVQWLVAREVAARAASYAGVSVVDEGLLQSLWSIGLRGDVEPVLTALDASRRERWADLLVVVKVAPEVALSRLAARESRHSRTQLAAADEQLAELRRGAELLDYLVGWWSSRPGPPRDIFVVSEAEEHGNHRERLLDHICALLDVTPGAEQA
jgi:dephospho-CoA kinase